MRAMRCFTRHTCRPQPAHCAVLARDKVVCIYCIAPRHGGQSAKARPVCCTRTTALKPARQAARRSAAFN